MHYQPPTPTPTPAVQPCVRAPMATTPVQTERAKYRSGRLVSTTPPCHAHHGLPLTGRPGSQYHHSGLGIEARNRRTSDFGTGRRSIETFRPSMTPAVPAPPREIGFPATPATLLDVISDTSSPPSTPAFLEFDSRARGGRLTWPQEYTSFPPHCSPDARPPLLRFGHL
ncbi:hypothetical protein B0T16DRAFT_61399 [Cercophora newfieldiana]|uniref:Uncharacterized protein n=1 Tax=Cercophora newfieldiana TaxID=92897 RepID=A0AA40CZL7_9PEZI|nr:hypothetical protein B0T16DRAFT_61399 [Cercophora newfieldiana]